jgi:hypothetical protein
MQDAFDKGPQQGPVIFSASELFAAAAPVCDP